MRINNKQQELIDSFYKKVKDNFPEIEFINLSASPDDPDYIWINVTAAMDDDREEEFIGFTAELEADIDIDYGYRISFMLENPNMVCV